MTLPEISIVIQSLIFVLFLASIALRLKGKYFAHVTTTFGAVVLMLSFFAWWIFSMAPTFDTYIQTILNPPLHLVNWLVHEILGIATLVSGAWIVLLWRRGSTEFVLKSKKIWQLTVILWISSYMVGLLFHVVLNTTFL